MKTKRLKEVKFKYDSDIEYPLNLKTTLKDDTLLEGIIDLTKREALALLVFLLKYLPMNVQTLIKIKDIIIKRIKERK